MTKEGRKKKDPKLSTSQCPFLIKGTGAWSLSRMRGHQAPYQCQRSPPRFSSFRSVYFYFALLKHSRPQQALPKNLTTMWWVRLKLIGTSHVVTEAIKIGVIKNGLNCIWPGRSHCCVQRRCMNSFQGVPGGGVGGGSFE